MSAGSKFFQYFLHYHATCKEPSRNHLEDRLSSNFYSRIVMLSSQFDTFSCFYHKSKFSHAGLFRSVLSQVRIFILWHLHLNTMVVRTHLCISHTCFSVLQHMRRGWDQSGCSREGSGEISPTCTYTWMEGVTKRSPLARQETTGTNGDTGHSS